MGNMADYYMDLAMEQDTKAEADRYFEREAVDTMEKHCMMGVLKWTTISGERIMVTKMTDAHIINSIGMIKRNDYPNGEVSKKWVELLGYELEKRK